MKTTIVLPDGLYRQVKITAAERGTTVRGIVIQSLRLGLSKAGPSDVDQRATDATRVLTDRLVNQLRDEEGV